MYHLVSHEKKSAADACIILMNTLMNVPGSRALKVNALPEAKVPHFSIRYGGTKLKHLKCFCLLVAATSTALG